MNGYLIFTLVAFITINSCRFNKLEIVPLAWLSRERCTQLCPLWTCFELSFSLFLDLFCRKGLHDGQFCQTMVISTALCISPVITC